MEMKSTRPRRSGRKRGTLAALAFGMLAAPSIAAAQSAIIYGSVGNFDISRNGKRKRKRNQGNIDPTTRAVLRRIEMYSFTGQYDPITHEALCADGTCSAPAVDEIGDLLSVQMSAANVQPRFRL